jgi:hypothetical protein
LYLETPETIVQGIDPDLAAEPGFSGMACEMLAELHNVEMVFSLNDVNGQGKMGYFSDFNAACLIGSP